MATNAVMATNFFHDDSGFRNFLKRVKFSNKVNIGYIKNFNDFYATKFSRDTVITVVKNWKFDMEVVTTKDFYEQLKKYVLLSVCDVVEQFKTLNKGVELEEFKLFNSECHHNLLIYF